VGGFVATSLLDAAEHPEYVQSLDRRDGPLTEVREDECAEPLELALKSLWRELGSLDFHPLVRNCLEGRRARQALIFLVCSRVVPQFEGAARVQSHVSSHLQGDFRVAAKAKVLLLLPEEVFEVPGAAARGREQEVQPVTVVDLFRADARPSITDRRISKSHGE